MSYYDIGDAIKLRTSTPFQNNSGTAIDPDTVTFTVREPDGTRTSYVYGVDGEVSREGTGDYSMIVRPDSSGVWRYAIAGEDASGNALSADEGRFEVRNAQARA